MERAKQRPRAQKNHASADARGKTCIDCHKGIAHLLPAEYDETVDEANFDTSPTQPAAPAPSTPPAPANAGPATSPAASPPPSAPRAQATGK
jgi:hypothetical protein